METLAQEGRAKLAGFAQKMKDESCQVVDETISQEYDKASKKFLYLLQFKAFSIGALVATLVVLGGYWYTQTRYEPAYLQAVSGTQNEQLVAVNKACEENSGNKGAVANCSTQIAGYAASLQHPEYFLSVRGKH